MSERDQGCTQVSSAVLEETASQSPANKSTDASSPGEAAIGVDTLKVRNLVRLHRIPRILGRLALVGSSIIMALTLAEVLLREIAPIYPVGIPEAYEYDAELGYRARPSIHLFKSTDLQQELRVNHMGTVNFQESFSGYKHLVYAVGDSFTQGTGVPSDASYPFQLDLILNLQPSGIYKKDFGVINLGIAAVGGDQELLILRRWVTMIGSPEYILYLGCDNDYDDDILFRSGYRFHHMVLGSPSWGWAAWPMQILTNDFQIGVRLKIFVDSLRRDEIYGQRNVATAEAKEPVAELEEPEIERIQQFSAKLGAVLIVSWSERGSSYEWLKHWAAERRIPFADWRHRVDSIQRAIPTLPEENFNSAGHHRSWVNREIAEAFASEITPHSRQSRIPRPSSESSR
jgi:hypothetical protein